MPEIISIKDVGDSEWDSFWNGYDSATFYHSRMWAEIWESYTSGLISPAAKIVTFSDGKRVLLPFSCQRYYRGLIKRYSLTGPPALALPYYGNWLTLDRLSDEHISSLTRYLIGSYKNLAWRLNPYDENSHKVVVQSKHVRRRPLVTYMIDLSNDEEYILSRMTQSCRNQTRQALRNQLTVVEAASIEDWRKYYDIYCDTLRRWGSKAMYILDWDIFSILFYKNSPCIKLLLVHHNNTAIAGGICFYSHKKIISWHIASRTEYHHLRPVNMFKYFIIKEGIRNHYRWFDFETAGSKKGLRKFKTSFGPEEKMCDMITCWHPVINTVRKYLKK